MIRRFLARWIEDRIGARRSTRPRIVLPDAGPPVYAVGDVHGCLDLLEQAEARIALDAAGQPGSTIVMLGDYVDRGPASAGVLDHLIAEPPAGIRRICLTGNHEDAMLRFIADPGATLEWLDFGGDATLRSYGIDARPFVRPLQQDTLMSILTDSIPATHLAFLATLPVALTMGNFVLVHAGVQPGIPLADQADEDLMWIREPFLSQGPGSDITVVHGHTPSERPVFAHGRIGIDTGAYMTGTLTVLKIHKGIATVL